MDDIQVSRSKTVLDTISRLGPRKTSVVTQKFTSKAEKESIELLQKQRTELQEEISKLILILSDEEIPLTNEEILETNMEINNLMGVKSQVENNLAKVSHGALGFHANIAPFIFFGRAKKIHQESLESYHQRPRVTAEDILGDPTTEVLEKIINNNSLEQVPKKVKLTRFDESSGDEE